MGWFRVSILDHLIESLIGASSHPGHLIESLPETNVHSGGVGERLTGATVETMLEGSIEGLEPDREKLAEIQTKSSVGTFVLCLLPVLLLEQLFLHAVSDHPEFFFRGYNFLYIFPALLTVILTFFLPCIAFFMAVALTSHIKNELLGIVIVISGPIASLVLLYWGESRLFPHATSVMQQMFFSSELLPVLKTGS